MFSLQFLFQSTCSWLCLSLGCHGSFRDVGSSVARAGTDASITHVALTSLASSHGGTAVLTSTALLSATTSIQTPLSYPTAINATTASSSSSLVASAPIDVSDPDVLTIASRRIDFIISKQTGANEIPTWCVRQPCIYASNICMYSYRLSTLGADGRWPASEVDYTRGCGARRANWPATGHWFRVGA